MFSDYNYKLLSKTSPKITTCLTWALAVSTTLGLVTHRIMYSRPHHTSAWSSQLRTGSFSLAQLDMRLITQLVKSGWPGWGRDPTTLKWLKCHNLVHIPNYEYLYFTIITLFPHKTRKILTILKFNTDLSSMFISRTWVPENRRKYWIKEIYYKTIKIVEQHRTKCFVYCILIEFLKKTTASNKNIVSFLCKLHCSTQFATVNTAAFILYDMLSHRDR